MSELERTDLENAWFDVWEFVECLAHHREDCDMAGAEAFLYIAIRDLALTALEEAMGSDHNHDEYCGSLKHDSHCAWHKLRRIIEEFKGSNYDTTSR